MATQHPTDDRLSGHETEDSMLDSAETVMRDMARDDAEGRPVCAACTQPALSKEAARDVPRVCRVEDVADEIRQRSAMMRANTASGIYGWALDCYAEAYREALPDPAECDVCQDRAAGGLPDCGHTRHGEDCPVAN